MKYVCLSLWSLLIVQALPVQGQGSEFMDSSGDNAAGIRSVAPVQSGPIKGNVTVNVDTQPLRLTRKGVGTGAGVKSSLSNTLSAPALLPPMSPLLDVQSFKSAVQTNSLTGKASAASSVVSVVRRNAPQDAAASSGVGVPLTGLVDSLSGLAKTLSAKANSAALSSKSAASAPYIWVQARDGGYYDATQTTQTIVPANKLYQYGGKFADGTPVPSSPIGSLNVAGHAYRAGSLNTDSFWRR